MAALLRRAPTTAEKILASSWDMSEPDQQPGLGAQVFRYMRGAPATEVTKEMQTHIAASERRKLKKAKGRDPDGDGD